MLLDQGHRVRKLVLGGAVYLPVPLGLWSRHRELLLQVVRRVLVRQDAGAHQVRLLDLLDPRCLLQRRSCCKSPASELAVEQLHQLLQLALGLQVLREEVHRIPLARHIPELEHFPAEALLQP